MYTAALDKHGAPITQEHIFAFGIVATRNRIMGHSAYGMTDDMGDLVDINFGGLAGSLNSDGEPH